MTCQNFRFRLANISGIPELTNSRGQPCRDSNPTQAWSFGTIMEVLADLQKYDYDNE